MTKRRRNPKLHELKDLPVPSFLPLLRARSVAAGGFNALAREITAAYREHFVNPLAPAPEFIIERRKLARLAEHDREVVLSLVELEALHAWLDSIEAGGLTKTPFFNHSSVIQALAGSADCSFVIGSRIVFEGPVLSHWDWQAMAGIQRTVKRFSSKMRFDLIDVHSGPARPSTSEWRDLFRPSGPSLVLLGSPRASRASEIALRKMLRPKNQPTARWTSLPFYFVFQTDGDAPTQFSRRPSQFGAEHPEMVAAVEAQAGWGLVAGHRAYLSERATKEQGGRRFLQDNIVSYGVIAAQRRPQGQVWVVVAGLTGPGTFAAASAVSSMTGILPEHPDDRSNPVLWGVVRAVVDTNPMTVAGKPPELRAREFVVQPSLWDPNTRRPAAG